MINFYWYEGQLRRYLLQFCNVFVGLKVQTGKGECDVPEFISVPIRIGSRDRVVAALQAGNTQAKPFSLPALAANMTGLSFGARKGVGVIDRRTVLPEGGIYPNDIKTLTRIMPIPYIMTIELAMYASNTEQLHQILEQLLLIFDPKLQIQISDTAADWRKITEIELTGINNEENYAPGTDRRVLVWTLNFDMPIQLSAPIDVRNEVVRQILIRLGDLSGFQIDEVDGDGGLSPFLPGYEYGTIEIDGDNP